MKSLRYLLLLTFVFLLLSTLSCTRESTSLKLGMMPAVDIAPFYHAQDSGIFESLGLEVELVLFTNAQNRQTALQTNQIDGAMTDLVALVTHAAGDFPLTGVLATEGIFPMLTAVADRFSSTESDDYQFPPKIGLMEISVVNYVAEQYMRQLFEIANYENIYITEIPARLEAVRNKQIDAGIFPEPVASIGEMTGLTKIVHSDIPAETLDIIAFTDKAIKEKRAAIHLLVQAYTQASNELNSDTDLTREVLLRHIPNLPRPAAELVTLPVYRPAHLQADHFIQEIIDWTSRIIKSDLEINPEDLIDRSFVVN
ncbi:ABC transporter substrate-binding protein [Spirochaeta dissipatitropha]